ncbi:unnamed protein product [Parascedosporium putredinis]|uniref:DNA/RNA-binding domain-containing protein n=1 Tax=Parascedosporium putredinis TaxID=1442378 RepID=A0A9P1GW59_9PEZI|nr:unnamed protein product [Parascedosporium putredinis]CAI7988130.1 unnamed protein product [Parascedosporium putredinis]
MDSSLDRKLQLYRQAQHRREQDPLPCIVCGAGVAKGLEAYTDHFTSAHSNILEREVTAQDDRASVARRQKFSGVVRDPIQPSVPATPSIQHNTQTTTDPTSQPKTAVGDVPATPASPPISSVSKASARPNRGSPVASSHGQGNPQRSRARQTVVPPDQEFSRPRYTGGALWSENSPRPSNKHSSRAAQPYSSTHSASARNRTGQQHLHDDPEGIYTGLVMVESKCIDVDTAQADDSAKALTDEQWQALIALHRALLHEHHDFFLASQHPSASQALKRLALKYTYSMMGLLYETVPTYKETWIECLGDLGRYRMAIEDENMQDRATWTAVSRHWYSKASDLSPDTGRLYHHLAILARPDRPIDTPFVQAHALDKREDPIAAQPEGGDGAETAGTVVEDSTRKSAGTTHQIPQPVLPATSSPQFKQARELFCDTARLLLRRLGDTNDKPPSRPLPEDYAMRGLLWVDGYLVNSLFESAEVDDEDKYFEVASFSAQRKERILWLGCQIARANGRWIRYDEITKAFTVAPEFDDEATADVDIEIEDAIGAEVQSPKQAPQPSPTPAKEHPKVDLRTLQVKIEVAEEHGEKGKRTTHTPAVQPGPQQGNDLGD